MSVTMYKAGFGSGNAQATRVNSPTTPAVPFLALHTIIKALHTSINSNLLPAITLKLKGLASRLQYHQDWHSCDKSLRADHTTSHSLIHALQLGNQEAARGGQHLPGPRHSAQTSAKSPNNELNAE